MDEEEKPKILVRLTEKGDLEVIDGKFRLQQLRAAGIEEVEVRVMNLNGEKPGPPNYRDIRSCANCRYSKLQCYEWYDCAHPDHPLDENGETKVCDHWEKEIES